MTSTSDRASNGIDGMNGMKIPVDGLLHAKTEINRDLGPIRPVARWYQGSARAGLDVIEHLADVPSEGGGKRLADLPGRALDRSRLFSSILRFRTRYEPEFIHMFDWDHNTFDPGSKAGEALDWFEELVAHLVDRWTWGPCLAMADCMTGLKSCLRLGGVLDATSPTLSALDRKAIRLIGPGLKALVIEADAATRQQAAG